MEGVIWGGTTETIDLGPDGLEAEFEYTGGAGRESGAPKPT
ncbi:MAG: hypothetical protein OXF33_09070 [Rhodospirillales bacterium]|nr:hypothetical protein [Rhodospirillales bacterium]